MAEIIVIASTVLALAFSIAWAWRPELRAWIERPKHSLDERVRRYDQAQHEEAGSPRSHHRE